MTALALRLADRTAGLRAAAAVALLVAAMIALSVFILVRDTANASTISVRITPAKAAQLINATSGVRVNDFQAIGDQAKLINAALPFVPSSA